MIDLLADKLGMDGVDLRRKNLIRPDEMPYTSPTGMWLDSEDYPTIVAKSLEFFDYSALRERAITQGKKSGMGLAEYIEINRANPGESAKVRLENNGSFTVISGLGGQGQGHVTMLQNLLSRELGVPKERIQPVFGDSDLLRGGVGTYGSRSTVAGGSAAIRAAQELKKKILETVSNIVHVPEDTLYYSEGSVRSHVDQNFRMDLKELAKKAGKTLESFGFYESKDTSSFGVHLAVVEADAETGKVRILKYMAADDAGKVIDEMSAESQIAGGMMQGIGEVFYEEMTYDEQGQPLVGTIGEAGVPSAVESLMPRSILFEFPSSFAHGARGIGEAGAIAAPPVLARAVENALRKVSKKNDGVRIRSTLLKPEVVLKLIS